MNNDLISRSDAEKHLVSLTGMFTDELGFAISLVSAVGKIRGIPAVDAEPVRHGRWMPYYEPMECFVDVYLNTEIRDVQVGWICSECGRHEQHSTVEEMPYCHCGAKMMVNRDV